MGKFVKMDIYCLGEECVGCEKLNINTTQQLGFADNEVQFVENYNACSNVEACDRIKAHLKKRFNINAEE